MCKYLKISQYIVYFFVLSIFFCQNAMSTQCVKSINPFKATIKEADIAVAGEIICYDDNETGEIFVKVTERFFGNCQDTIRCFDNGWGGAFISSKPGDKVIMLLHKWSNSNNLYYFEECGTYVLSFNDQKNNFSGHITHFNGFVCRTLLFCGIFNLPLNHMSYRRIEKIIKRKSKNKVIYS